MKDFLRINKKEWMIKAKEQIKNWMIKLHSLKYKKMSNFKKQFKIINNNNYKTLNSQVLLHKLIWKDLQHLFHLILYQEI
jgi:hypothetical protein